MEELIEVRRKAFEVWARETFYSGLAFPSDTWSESRSMYNDPGHHMAFKAWQAALDSVVIELPPVELLTGDDGVDDEVMCPQRVIKAIHAAGIKTKVMP